MKVDKEELLRKHKALVRDLCYYLKAKDISFSEGLAACLEVSAMAMAALELETDQAKNIATSFYELYQNAINNYFEYKHLFKEKDNE